MDEIKTMREYPELGFALPAHVPGGGMWGSALARTTQHRQRGGAPIVALKRKKEEKNQMPARIKPSKRAPGYTNKRENEKTRQQDNKITDIPGKKRKKEKKKETTCEAAHQRPRPQGIERGGER